MASLPAAGAKRSLFLVRPSRSHAAPTLMIPCTAGAYAALLRWAGKFSITERLTIDEMLLILDVVWRTWPLATRTLRVSKEFATAATLARRRLPAGEWWTGSGRPLEVPKSLKEAIDLEVLLRPGALARLKVGGGDVGDVTRTLLGVRARLTHDARACLVVRVIAGMPRSAPRPVGRRASLTWCTCCVPQPRRARRAARRAALPFPTALPYRASICLLSRPSVCSAAPHRPLAGAHLAHQLLHQPGALGGAA